MVSQEFGTLLIYICLFIISFCLSWLVMTLAHDKRSKKDWTTQDILLVTLLPIGLTLVFIILYHALIITIQCNLPNAEYINGRCVTPFVDPDSGQMFYQPNQPTEMQFRGKTKVTEM